MRITRQLQTTPRGVDLQNRTVEGMVSTRAVDSYGSIIVPDGISLARYQKNPVFLRYHRRDDVPIGTCIGMKIVPGEGLECKFQLSETPEGQSILEAYSRNEMRGFSVGGTMQEVVTSWEDRKSKKWADLPGYALQALNDGAADFAITKFDLAEVSAVPVPSNPEALAYRDDEANEVALQLVRVNCQVEQLIRWAGEERAALLAAHRAELESLRSANYEETKELVRVIILEMSKKL